MIHHLSIAARDPKHVAGVLAEFMGGKAVPFPPNPGASLRFSSTSMARASRSIRRGPSFSLAAATAPALRKSRKGAATARPISRSASPRKLTPSRRLRAVKAGNATAATAARSM